jgi:hypothetical protein
VFFTFAPFPLPHAEREMGRGMVELLQAKAGVSFIASHDRSGYLKIYGSGHLHTHLVSISALHFGGVWLDRFICDSKP